MNTAKRLLACGLALTMVAGLTACDEEPAVTPDTSNGGAAVATPAPMTTTTQASTTIDPNDALDMTDKRTK